MTDKPIIFSGPMVQALLDGRKTQTRRVLKPQPAWGKPELYQPMSDEGPYWAVFDADHIETRLRVPYAIGDRFYVKEPWRVKRVLDGIAPSDFLPFDHAPIWFEADSSRPEAGNRTGFGRLRSGMHMLRRASSLTLTVTEVRVQRLQEISEADAVAEGCPFPNMQDGPSPRDWFRDLWNALHPTIVPRSPGTSKANSAAWDANPWVAALTFTVQHGNIDAEVGVTDGA